LRILASNRSTPAVTCGITVDATAGVFDEAERVSIRIRKPEANRVRYRARDRDGYLGVDVSQHWRRPDVRDSAVKMRESERLGRLCRKAVRH